MITKHQEVMARFLWKLFKNVRYDLSILGLSNRTFCDDGNIHCRPFFSPVGLLFPY